MRKYGVLFSILVVASILLFKACDDSDKHGIDLDIDSDAYTVKRVYNTTPFEYAWTFYGEEELYGASHNNVIVSFWNGILDWVKDDETPWCSAFMNHTHLSTGYKYTGKANARSWLDLDSKVKDPKPGDIAIFWRNKPNSWQGHVGFFLRYNPSKSKILVYGGNQNNKLAPMWYSSNRLLGFRKSIYDYDCQMGCETSDKSMAFKLDSITRGLLDDKFPTFEPDSIQADSI